MPIEIGDTAALGDLVEGKSDDDLLTLAKENDGGPESVLDEMFEGMTGSFDAEAAAGKSAIIQYELDVEGDKKHYVMTVADGTCKLSKGEVDNARVTMVMGFPDFLRLAAQKLDGMQAFMSGKLKLRGDMMFAQQMANWFGQN